MLTVYRSARTTVRQVVLGSHKRYYTVDLVVQHDGVILVVIVVIVGV